MRFIYMDEAGISATEPVSVVAGIIVNADKQLDLVDSRIRELINEYIPASARAGFAFHATDIFSGRKLFKRPEYPLDRAIKLLTALVSIPMEMGLPIALSAFRQKPLVEKYPAHARKHEEANHAMAFSLCAMKAERYIRERAEPSETAKIVAENNTTTQKRLKDMQEMLRGESRNQSHQSVFRIFAATNENSLPLKRIKHSVFFAGKTEEPLLQIADAVAFTVRRFYEGKRDIDQFMVAMMGGAEYRPPPLEKSIGGMSTIISGEYGNLQQD